MKLSLMAHAQTVCSRIHWITADGRIVRVHEMADSHLLNTVRRLRRECRQEDREAFLLVNVKPYKAMIEELVSRGLEPSRAQPMARKLLRDLIL